MSDFGVSLKYDNINNTHKYKKRQTEVNGHNRCVRSLRYLKKMKQMKNEQTLFHQIKMNEGLDRAKLDYKYYNREHRSS